MICLFYFYFLNERATLAYRAYVNYQLVDQPCYVSRALQIIGPLYEIGWRSMFLVSYRWCYK